MKSARMSYGLGTVGHVLSRLYCIAKMVKSVKHSRFKSNTSGNKFTSAEATAVGMGGAPTVPDDDVAIGSPL